VTEFFAHRQEPMAINIRVNAGYIAKDHWIQQAEQGGRVIGEFCHFLDWARAVVGKPIQSFTVRTLPDSRRYNRDNVLVTMSFADGSIANLMYLANGDKTVPKEHFEVFCQGGVAVLDDFRKLELTRDGKTKRIKGQRDKGHRRELQLTINAIRSGNISPIPFEELIEISSCSIAIHGAICREEEAISIATTKSAVCTAV
jgi:predicted dehydrogenase